MIEEPFERPKIQIKLIVPNRVSAIFNALGPRGVSHK